MITFSCLAIFCKALCMQWYRLADKTYKLMKWNKSPISIGHAPDLWNDTIKVILSFSKMILDVNFKMFIFDEFTNEVSSFKHFLSVIEGEVNFVFYLSKLHWEQLLFLVKTNTNSTPIVIDLLLLLPMQYKQDCMIPKRLHSKGYLNQDMSIHVSNALMKWRQQC